MSKGRLVSRPTEDAALARCKNLGMKIDQEVIIAHYKNLYGEGYLAKMPSIAKNLIAEKND